MSGMAFPDKITGMEFTYHTSNLKQWKKIEVKESTGDCYQIDLQT